MTNKSYLTHLPNDLQLSIANYLTETEKIWFGSCCVSFYHGLLINHLRRFKILNKSHFLTDYENNKEVRERFEKCIRFPERQVYVQISNSFPDQGIPFTRIYSLNVPFNKLQQLLQDNKLEKIHTLEVDFYSSTVSSSDITLPESYGIKNLIIRTYNVRVTIIPPHSLETLRVRGPYSGLPFQFNEVFSHLRELEFNNVEAIGDVRMFVNIQKLSFFACNSITDITPLQTTRDISIGSCSGILDYRNALTYSHRIKISSGNPHAIIDISCFKEVKSLTIQTGSTVVSNSSQPSTLTRLSIVRNIQHLITCFDHLQELTVTYSEVLTKVDMFSCIPVLRLFNLSNVRSLRGLGYNDDVTKKRRNRAVLIYELYKVKDFTPLNTIPRVDISSCDGFVDLGQVKDVKNLAVSYCNNILPPSVPMKAEQVTLGGKIKHSLLEYFPNVKELHLSDVTGSNEWSLEGLETLIHLERVDISSTSSWEEQESKGWEVLREQFSKLVSGFNSVIYVKKRMS